jgi:hypothetical protein
MSSAPILSRADAGPDGPAWRWLARAEQARRIASILSPADAELAEAYAIECEVNALRHVGGLRAGAVWAA